MKDFYKSLRFFLKEFNTIIPAKKQIFNVFTFIKPSKVKVVLFGEDPYPRITSACGIAFRDMEVNTWDARTRGSSLKNILKGLLIYKGLATYNTPIAECRIIAGEQGIKSPPELFDYWLKKGILLVNTSLTYTTGVDKKRHFSFWEEFQKNLIEKINRRQGRSPYFILWGGKAQKWGKIIADSIDDKEKIICQGHPAFIHQFLDKENPSFSPFFELSEKTGIVWY
ncbi:MAG: hypothetical protein JXJ04_23895 [Spirochaetales bacterium]|nr:hypothetical protein [Spirochaetales bacterium]